MADASTFVQYDKTHPITLTRGGVPVGITINIVSFDSERVSTLQICLAKVFILAGAICCIDFLAGAVIIDRHLYPQITGYTQQRNLMVHGVDTCQDHRVGQVARERRDHGSQSAARRRP